MAGHVQALSSKIRVFRLHFGVEGSEGYAEGRVAMAAMGCSLPRRRPRREFCIREGREGGEKAEAQGGQESVEAMA